MLVNKLWTMHSCWIIL